MEVRLEPGDVAFKYGRKLKNDAVKVLIESKEENDGGISRATITVVYELDISGVFSSKKNNEPADGKPYLINFDEVGYVGNGDLFSGDLQKSELYITISDAKVYLNTRIPLVDAKKRENIQKRLTDAENA